MTLRLIGLMSVLLFVALSTFSLLLSRSEDAIMREVERTISTAGSETLRAVLSGTTLAECLWTGAEPPVAVGFAIGEEAPTAQVTSRILVRRGVKPDPQQPAAGEDTDLMFLVAPARPLSVAPRQAGELHFEVRLSAAAVDVTQRMEPSMDLAAAGAAPATAVADDGDGEPQPSAARADPPAVRVEKWVGALPGTATLLTRTPPGLPSGEAMEEFRFRMSTSHYQALFAAVKKRLWMLFLAVFAVGSICSIGLANRFTRPIRELDAALRRVAVDDLDARVRESGSGEVVRLTRAFNQMAGRLRVARDRSRELARREKLSALGRLAAGVAHDVRNPLHSINLTMQHLCDTCRPADAAAAAEFDHAARLIHGEVRRLDRLVGNFLRFARRDAAETRPVRLDEMLAQTAELVAKEAESRGVRIEVDADPADPEVQVGVESLRAALLNLVLNSLDAMRGGGALWLRARVASDSAWIEVADTGVGIREEDRERVFDFGFTTRDDGHGLGLAMVHQIVVEEHGGRVSMTSRVGVGTTFRLELPVAAPAEVMA